jgi:hypothetical protein
MSLDRKSLKRVNHITKKEELSMRLLDDPKIPQPDEILGDHTTPTSLLTLPPRWG